MPRNFHPPKTAFSVVIIRLSISLLKNLVFARKTNKGHSRNFASEKTLKPNLFLSWGIKTRFDVFIPFAA